MDINMIFRMGSQTKAQMTEICAQPGMTPSTAFHIFANTFVHTGSMRFAGKQAPPTKISRAQMLEDASKLLNTFSADYKKMAE